LFNREKQRKQREKGGGWQNRGPAWTPGGQFAPKPLMGGGRDDQRLSNVRQEAAEMRIRVSSTYFVWVF
jgi:hypothetical protein